MAHYVVMTNEVTCEMKKKNCVKCVIILKQVRFGNLLSGLGRDGILTIIIGMLG